MTAGERKATTLSDDKGSGRGLDATGLWIVLAVVVVVGGVVLLGGRDGDHYQPPKPEPWAGWKTTGIVLLILVGSLVPGLVVYTLVRLALSLAAAWHAHRHRKALDALDVQRTADQVETGKARAALDAARVQPWTEHGRLGALVRQTPHGWQVVNLDAEAGALLLGYSGGVDRLLADPLTLAQLQARHDLEKERARASAYPSLTTYNQRLQLAGGDITGEAAAPPVNWPSQVMLRLGGLVLGITIFPGTGVARPVTAALSELVHVAVGGSSGWGKSVFLRALALQFATAAESCRLALIDLEGATFAPFASSERLLWPVADTEADALAIMARLVEEMNRRKELYQAFPGVDSLAAFNARAAEPLPPVIALIDEATALLSDRSVHNATRAPQPTEHAHPLQSAKSEPEPGAAGRRLRGGHRSSRSSLRPVAGPTPDRATGAAGDGGRHRGGFDRADRPRRSAARGASGWRGAVVRTRRTVDPVGRGAQRWALFGASGGRCPSRDKSGAGAGPGRAPDPRWLAGGNGPGQIGAQGDT